ncbi:unnamed protein product [Oikopleura dioica]|uniref:GST N-terminal domain-containing protein n=1 Tax=Oikopleura dioica TaxID=34765 RepID=E4XLY2_OIKDI|nr:unnamed protein product [Oikopleura dioica]CBY37441.1 unnamed protein product [Oikopleura dioica]
MGKLYSYADNFRADKIKAVAAISGYKLEIASDYVHGVTNKTAEFESKFFGKVPAFEDGSTALCNDNAIAHFVGNEQTRGGANGGTENGRRGRQGRRGRRGRRGRSELAFTSDILKKVELLLLRSCCS